MPEFLAKVEFRFEAESLQLAGRDLRRLQQAAQAAGFELRRGEAVPAPPEEKGDSDWTRYGPITRPEE